MSAKHRRAIILAWIRYRGRGVTVREVFEAHNGINEPYYRQIRETAEYDLKQLVREGYLERYHKVISNEQRWFYDTP